MKPLTQQEVEEVFGKFDYEDLGNGLIKIDPVWTKENLVTVDFPCVGIIRCHKLLMKTFTEIKESCHSNFITLKGGGGSYCPRHKCWDKRRELSHHAWAIALDANVAANPYGKRLNLPLSFNMKNEDTAIIVEIFEANGFFWGGRWMRKPDTMHMSFCQIEKLGDN